LMSIAPRPVGSKFVCEMAGLRSDHNTEFGYSLASC
jgi:hypothetical protein